MISRSKKSKSRDNARSADVARAPKPKLTCAFCDNKAEPTYTDSATLKKYLSDRAKIIARGRTGLCSRHQRRVATEIKHARHLSLLPFIARV